MNLIKRILITALIPLFRVSPPPLPAGFSVVPAQTGWETKMYKHGGMNETHKQRGGKDKHKRAFIYQSNEHLCPCLLSLFAKLVCPYLGKITHFSVQPNNSVNIP